MRKTKPVKRYMPKTITRWATVSLVCDVSSFVFIIGVVVAVSAVPGDIGTLIGGIFGLLFMLALLGSVIATNRVLYCAWAQIQDSGTSITPTLAVLLNFVPLVNVVWVFFSFAGLARRMNDYMLFRGIDGPPAPHGRCLTACVLLACGTIPYIGALPALIGVIFLMVAIVGIANTAAAIAENDPHPSRAPRTQQHAQAYTPEPALEAARVRVEAAKPVKRKPRRPRKSGPFDEPEKL